MRILVISDVNTYSGRSRPVYCATRKYMGGRRFILQRENELRCVAVMHDFRVKLFSYRNSLVTFDSTR